MMSYKITVLYLFLVVAIAEGQDCFPSGLVVNSQQSIDNFIIEYPDCTEVFSLTIEGNDIVNLNGFSNLDLIQQDLNIQNCPLLNDLTGISDVGIIGNKLLIENNESLQEITSFDSLKFLGGLNIIENLNLGTITGFSGLEVMNGNVLIRSNDNLIDFCILDNTTLMIGDFNFNRNNNINNLACLDNLMSIEGTIRIGADSLKSITGFKSLTSILEDFRFANVRKLESVTGFQNLTEIGGLLEINETNNLSNIDFLSNLTSFTTLICTRNTMLKNLEPLSNVSSLVNELRIQSNMMLESLKGLQNIDYSSIDFLTVVDNPFLSECSILPICDIIDQNQSLVLFAINLNKEGCMTEDDVFSRCLIDSTNIEFSICPGESIEVNDNSYSIPGIYSFVETTCLGLDSIINVVITESGNCDNCDFQIEGLGFQIKRDLDGHYEFLDLKLNSSIGISFKDADEMVKYLSDQSTKYVINSPRKISPDFNKIAGILEKMKYGSIIKL